MKQKMISIAIVLLLAIGSIGAVGLIVSAKETMTTQDYVSGELLVGFNDNIKVEDLKIGDRDPVLNNIILNKFDPINCVLVSVNKGTENKYIYLYERSSDVAYAETNGYVKLVDYPFEPNDPKWGSQYGPKNIKCPQAWSYNNYDSGVTIAIVDTGIHMAHEDLQSRIVNGHNSVGSGAPQDNNGHGTHCAGIAAAVTDNGKGIAGVCGKVDVNLMPVKVLSSSGSGTFAQVTDGIVWATQNGADVISMSLGASSGSDSLKNACDNADAAGIIVVAAAGNEGDTAKHYPAAYDSVVSVAAVDSKDSKASFSTYGSWVDVAAPGVRILSSIWKNDATTDSYTYLSGTSMACPHVAGVAALGIAGGRENVKQAIFDNAIDIGHTGSWWKYGKVDASYGGQPPTQIGVDVKVTDVILKDAIEPPGSSPEWYYEIDVSLEGSNKRLVEENTIAESNKAQVVSEMSGDKIKVLQIPEDHSSSDNWYPNYIHSLWLKDSDVGGAQVLINVKITLMEEDWLYNDIADISAKENVDGDPSIIAGEQKKSGRVFECQYDLLSNKLVGDFGGSRKIGGGDDDGSFPRETAGYWDSSQDDGEAIGHGREDDTLLKFDITDTYEAVEANAGGPYKGIANADLDLHGSATNGKAPYTFKWDLDNDGQYDDAEGQDITHKFNTLGDNTISLEVTDDYGLKDTDETTVNIVSNTDPDMPTISGPSSGSAGNSYSYTVSASDPDDDRGDKVWYKICWDNNRDPDDNTGWQGPFNPGYQYSTSHTWNDKGNYQVKVYVKDKFGATNSNTMSVTMPKSKSTDFSKLYRLIENFPLLRNLLNLLFL